MRMMENLILKKPDATYAEQIIEYKKEFLAADSSMDGCSTLRSTDDPYEFIKNCELYSKKETVPSYLVPETLFMLIREGDGRLIGMVDIRHYLNEYLLKHGGHIGYSVRPSERRRGYAKKMLSLALIECKKLNIERALVTCDDTNIASEKTILANGGVLESVIYNPDTGTSTKRFWIKL